MSANHPEIPPKLTQDQYDKLLRRLWDLEQRMVTYDKTIILHENLNDLFNKQVRIENQITEWKKASSNLLAVLVKILEK